MPACFCLPVPSRQPYVFRWMDRCALSSTSKRGINADCGESSDVSSHAIKVKDRRISERRKSATGATSVAMGGHACQHDSNRVPCLQLGPRGCCSEREGGGVGWWGGRGRRHHDKCFYWLTAATAWIFPVIIIIIFDIRHPVAYPLSAVTLRTTRTETTPLFPSFLFHFINLPCSSSMNTQIYQKKREGRGRGGVNNTQQRAGCCVAMASDGRRCARL